MDVWWISDFTKTCPNNCPLLSQVSELSALLKNTLQNLFRWFSAAGVLVHLGSHNIAINDPNQTVVESRNLIIHSDYNEERIIDDIGLIVLDEPVELNEYIDVIAMPPRYINTDYTGKIIFYVQTFKFQGMFNPCLFLFSWWTVNLAASSGYNAKVSGWGLVSSDGNRPSLLQEANVTVISNFQCRQVYSIVTDFHLCTLGDAGESICDGDSGSPLVTGNTQIGIVSYGSGSCNGSYPSGFTRVSRYLDWLEEKTGLKF